MILVTGATGFVGSALIARLARDGLEVRAAVRRMDVPMPKGVSAIQVDDLSADTNWGEALKGVEVVVHAAARVHVMSDTAADPLAEFRRANVQGTLALMRQAAAAGVRRLVFISSIKVNGEESRPGSAFHADDGPVPVDPYGISKMEAELGLMALAQETSVDVVIIRPPLVYGPGVKANFRSMMRWLGRGVPLPLGAINNNRRSLVMLDNLVDLIVTCIHHPAAANQVFLVSDGEDISTTQLLQRMAKALGASPHLFPVPVGILAGAARLLGRADMVQRLCGSLQVDISKTQSLLNWRPPVEMDDGLRRTARAFLDETTI